MLQAASLVDSLKRELKARGITYADLAVCINMSEASVKRMFSQRNFTLQRLDEILEATQIDFREQAYGDYPASRFDRDNELMRRVSVMLSRQSIVALLDRLKQVAREFSHQHQDDAKVRK